jgi:hypothetical protein
MHIAEVTALLAQLEEEKITWEQALVEVTALPNVWQTKEWKEQRESLIGDCCAVCETTQGPFVLQHLFHCYSFKEVCQIVKEGLRLQLLPQVAATVTDAVVEAHIGPGKERQACPICTSVSIRERKTMEPRYICSRGENGWHRPAGFSTPVAVRYYEKQKTTDFNSAKAIAREFLVSVAMVAELRKHDDAIQHEATLRSLRQSLIYRSLKHTATYCKICAFKEDLPAIERKEYYQLIKGYK